MPVKDPQQNTHRWWGVLKVDKNTELIDGTVDLMADCIFLKTSRDAHFISQETLLKKVKLLSASGDVNAAISRINDVSPSILNMIREDLLSGHPEGIPIVEILEADYPNTSPLTSELNARTEILFRDVHWLDMYASRVGKENIVIGMAMAGLPKK
jgi:hypothetical protein